MKYKITVSCHAIERLEQRLTYLFKRNIVKRAYIRKLLEDIAKLSGFKRDNRLRSFVRSSIVLSRKNRLKRKPKKYDHRIEYFVFISGIEFVLVPNLDERGLAVITSNIRIGKDYNDLNMLSNGQMEHIIKMGDVMKKDYGKKGKKIEDLWETHFIENIGWYREKEEFIKSQEA